MSLPPVVVLATRNAKKQTELQRILTAHGIATEVRSLADFPHHIDDVVESAPDFEGNALLKATAAFEALGLPSIADDSGLCVDALNGMPGVLSARWAGTRDDEDNLNLVLAQLRDVPDERRGAQFVAAVSYVAENDVTFVVRGVMAGRIGRTPSGSEGFGYDPIFMADGKSVTNAELSPFDKDALSHRGQALNILVERLRRM
jgi:XTP/dITP diphosphohydrolase